MVLAEIPVVLEDVLPGIVGGMAVADGSLAVDLLAGYGIASVVCAGEVVAVVVSELGLERKSFYRELDLDIAVYEDIPAGILLVSIDILHRVREVAVVHRLLVVCTRLILVDTVWRLLDGMFEIRSDTA